MHVLVTGGAGFIGSHSVEALLEANFPVRVLDNFSTGSRQNLPTHSLLEIQVGNIHDGMAVHKAMQGITHVLHLAAQVSVQASVEDPFGSCSTNIGGFVNVLQTARSCGVERMVYASSAAVYGRPTRLPLRETDMAQPCSPYGLEKYVNDQYAALFAKEFGQSLLGLRYFNVYGPRQDPSSPYAGVISKFISMIEQQRPLSVFGDGTQTRDFIFVRDIAKANVQALQSEMAGVCNVATGRSVTLLDLIEVLSGCVNRKLGVVHLSAQPGDIPFSEADILKLSPLLRAQNMTSLNEGLSSLLQSSIQIRQ
ncbi:MAG: NAD-dependent epimerase/dehydratase family protein [Nitrospirales bacterium]|nr:MAG: NAD-dependent epimerase/dehydratase family protein [Nitrospirales bacterium]